MNLPLRAAALALIAVCLTAVPVRSGDHTFVVGKESFLLDGKPFLIRSGEMHHERIPPEYWRHRLKMVRAMGCNTVCAYLYWNRIEPQPGVWNFSGSSDVAAYCRIAQEEGLKVILRPGPYSCAEWDFGGFPWWLLRYPDIRLRTRDPRYLAAVEEYLRAVGRELGALQWTRGGPIIMVQVENEYGSYGKDTAYIRTVRDNLRKAGFEVPLFTCDGPTQLVNDARPDIFSVVNFGDDPEGAFAALRKIRPEGPLMCGEFYPGWFDSWGKKHHTGATEPIIRDLKYMLDRHASFSIYMVHGGTSFGFTAGANCPPFSPQTTSYDYDAPITENGEATPKYRAIRELFGNYLLPGETLPPVPEPQPRISIARTRLERCEALADLSVSPERIRASSAPLTMEELGQGQGCVRYAALLPPGPAGRLLIREAHDVAIVSLDGKRIGTCDRRRRQKVIDIPARECEMKLDILVEAMGHVNYGDYLHDRKGIVGTVCLVAGADTQVIGDWRQTSYVLDSVSLAAVQPQSGPQGPAFFRGTIRLDSIGDSFLDVRRWNKGFVWVNGHNLGRYWNIGPQQTLYCPAPWLKQGSNEILILDLGDSVSVPEIEGLDRPILDDVREIITSPYPDKGLRFDLDSLHAAASGEFIRGSSWQRIGITPATVRYLCLESVNSQDGDPFASCAELICRDAAGRIIPRDRWRISAVSSEELSAEDGAASNVLDGDPESIWHTEWGDARPPHPHRLVIDFGSEMTISSVEYLPRPGNNPPGRIRLYRLYLSSAPFRFH